ncbi:SpoVT / AbrB like domain protein [Gemmata obscuriglobus]|uniref:AbrB/MazE/SpoVT family DNA-binding domain-containing protein n=1 Tax=Gemmata obscuriglobus TaxID=114 RepID=A0A2Z3H051_9BACT|nr:AbrB/MazE/SpoVT family DNA-binding domain-containing protein [Gemmata obscuriglobus]AWM40149.1 AbrB/MazE/SpoVT family DNA-binding domain-containing protein [Gemmata obscuriglobus]QEG26675.1 SpoVT / AbrB like domain protein [Gemmata obscuriglobus]VTS02314.1 Looped-hinge helix DNA binding domain, AbrB family OS=Synechococcus sp. PCC 7502 GN=Syn7502_01435 PE=4 SV=1: Antitoxin-MazE [Gemmata obscuriglobus UQM 2246]
MQIEHVILGKGGRLVIPITMRNEIGIQAGDILVLESDGDSLLVRTRDRVLREVQASFADIVPADVLLSDELIAERRADAERDCRN